MPWEFHCKLILASQIRTFKGYDTDTGNTTLAMLNRKCVSNRMFTLKIQELVVISKQAEEKDCMPLVHI